MGRNVIQSRPERGRRGIQLIVCNSKSYSAWRCEPAGRGNPNIPANAATIIIKEVSKMDCCAPLRVARNDAWNGFAIKYRLDSTSATSGRSLNDGNRMMVNT